MKSIKLYNLPLFKHLYYWNVLPKENLSPLNLPVKNVRLFNDAYHVLNLALKIMFILTAVGVSIAGWTNSFKSLFIILIIGFLISSILYLKRKRLIDMVNDYHNDLIKIDCF